MPRRADVVARSAARIGLDVPDRTSHEVFGLLRLAGIVQPSYLRYARGATADPRFADSPFFGGVLFDRCRRLAGLA